MVRWRGCFANRLVGCTVWKFEVAAKRRGVGAHLDVKVQTRNSDVLYRCRRGCIRKEKLRAMVAGIVLCEFSNTAVSQYPNSQCRIATSASSSGGSFVQDEAVPVSSAISFYLTLSQRLNPTNFAAQNLRYFP